MDQLRGHDHHANRAAIAITSRFLRGFGGFGGFCRVSGVWRPSHLKPFFRGRQGAGGGGAGGGRGGALPCGAAPIKNTFGAVRFAAQAWATALYKSSAMCCFVGHWAVSRPVRSCLFFASGLVRCPTCIVLSCASSHSVFPSCAFSRHVRLYLFFATACVLSRAVGCPNT